MGLEDIQKEHREILKQLSDPELISNWESFEELSKRKSHLDKILLKYAEIDEMKEKIKENQAMITANEDSELVVLAEGEMAQLIEKQRSLEEEVVKLEKEGPEKDSSDHNQTQKYPSVIIEVRAGTGGEEAALFASDLYRMYTRYAELEGWKATVLDSKPTTMGGMKEITFEIAGNDVFSSIQHEGGVHRVQRIPSTEKSGRIHTSTATVAILPKPKKSEIKIRTDELKIDLYRSSGPGGQNVNKRETAVRITHLPTGMVVTSQTERNQLKNRESAMSILEAKLLEKKIVEEEEKVAGNRKGQVGWAKRSEKIRTYNYPQDRLTDHRIKKSWHNLAKILDGNLEPIVKALKQLAE